jgi:hypothetical protein
MHEFARFLLPVSGHYVLVNTGLIMAGRVGGCGWGGGGGGREKRWRDGWW